MSAVFLHGVEVLEVEAGPRPVRTVRSGVVGVVGTAPGASGAVAAVLSTGRLAANTLLQYTATAGVAGNLISVNLVDPGTAEATLAVAVSGSAITVTLATSAASAITSTAAQVLAAINGDTDAAALVTVTHGTGSDGSGVAVPTRAAQFLTGGADEPFPLNTPRLIAGSRAEAAKLGATGTLPDALDGILDQIGAVVVVVRVAEGVDEAATLANIVGGVNQVDGNLEGVHALAGAESVTGFAPRILIAPGWTHQRPSGARNPVVAELVGIAERLRAVIIADGPNTTDEAAIAAREDWGSDRLFIVDPGVKVFEAGATTNRPASPRVAGLIAKTDYDLGFWHSPSNKLVNGITGTARPVDFRLGDASSRANLLNEQEVATIVRETGFRLWGNRTTSADPKFAFLSVRRTADIIADSLQRAHLWAVDRNITRTYVEEVTDSVNGYLRTLRDLGAIINGECWADEDLNTPATIAQGKIYFNFDFTPPYPAEHVIFRSHLVDTYITEIFE